VIARPISALPRVGAKTRTGRLPKEPPLVRCWPITLFAAARQRTAFASAIRANADGMDLIPYWRQLRHDVRPVRLGNAAHFIIDCGGLDLLREHLQFLGAQLDGRARIRWASFHHRRSGSIARSTARPRSVSTAAWCASEPAPLARMFPERHHRALMISRTVAMKIRSCFATASLAIAI
jgi:hypothetical protein